MTTQPVIPLATLVRVALKAAVDAGADDTEIEIVLGRTIAQLRAIAASGSPDLPDPDETRCVGDAFRMWTARAAAAAPAPAPAPATGRDLSTVTNAEFIAPIMARMDPANRMFVTAFHGNPQGQGNWLGYVYTSQTTIEQAAENTYLTLAEYRADNGTFRRREAQCVAIHGIMLDDIGTKAQGLSRLAALAPSWVLETSPGNYQCVYLFSQPVTDIAAVKALHNLLVAAGLCDKGAKSAATRWMRLPVGSNGKYNPPVPCKLIEWEPTRRYSMAEIEQKLQLATAVASSSSTASVSPAMPAPPAGTGSPINPADNAVIAALKAAGTYKSKLADGWHDITCPWVSQHTGAINHGTAYHEPSDEFPLGGFKCQHSHGDDLHIGDLLRHLKLRPAQATGKQIIKVAKGQDAPVFRQLCKTLADTGNFYQAGSSIVRVAPGRDSPLVPMTKEALGLVVDSMVTWEGYVDGRSGSGKHVIVDTPERYIKALAGAGQWSALAEIKGIARQPHIRPDGSLADKPGYDTATGVYGIFEPGQFAIPAQPTRTDAQAALGDLQSLIDEFAFARPVDEGAAIATMLTGALRAGLELAPLTHCNAPQRGSGKSYLGQVFYAFATDRPYKTTPYPTDADEMAKTLVTLLREGATAIFFDDMNHDMTAPSMLRQAVTSEQVSMRQLGSNVMINAGTRALLLSNGNNVEVSADMARRALTVRLDTQMESPAERVYSKNPVALLQAQRGRFVGAALTITRAWIEAGRPETPCRNVNGFRQWGELVRQPLLWLGLPDPAESIFENLADDPDRELLGPLLRALHAAFGSHPTTAAAMLNHYPRVPVDADAPVLREVIDAIAGDPMGRERAQRLGLWLRRHVGQPAAGLVLCRHKSGHGTASWIVKTTGKQAPP